MGTVLSVIIVNYNGLNYLEACLASLYEKLAGITFEIIIIDNASTDGSCAYIKQHHPRVLLIESIDNLGFGKGNNEAVKIAAGEYLLLINNDTIVLNNLLPVLDFIKKDSTIGAVGIKMLDGNKKYLQSVGKFPDFKGFFKIKNISKAGADLEKGNFTKPFYEVDWITGSFLMMPKKVYTAVGGFDEDYFMYVEDVDLGKRIHDRGYKNIFLPQYSYIHFVGFKKARNPLLIKGYETYIAKHFKGTEAKKMRLALKINKTVKSLKSFLKTD